jgi:hypothetical protein
MTNIFNHLIFRKILNQINKDKKEIQRTWIIHLILVVLDALGVKNLHRESINTIELIWWGQLLKVKKKNIDEVK